MKRISILVWVIFGFLATAAPLCAASSEKVLYSFCSAGNCDADGYWPESSLIFDASGNLYGTTIFGGPGRPFCQEGQNFGCGIVFQLTPGTGSTWTETVLYGFVNNGTDGVYPYAGLILDAAGNLYGTTVGGGQHGNGTVFKLAPGANGTWTETVLYSFCSANNCIDGAGPSGSLIFDAARNLYGTTGGGGFYGNGTVFKLAPGTNGTWTEEVLHSFGNNGTEGWHPSAGLIFDAAGNLYGTTVGGGQHGNGTVFKLAPATNGKWKENVLYSFIGFPKSDGAGPSDSLILDAAGNLYGTTVGGGQHGNGTVFELAPGTNGTWTEKVLHSFNGNNGAGPYAGLIFDAAGNLYGTTSGGGTLGYGTAFELTPHANGRWTEKVWNFGYIDGAWPYAGLIFDASGNLYGTTTWGGTGVGGAVFGTIFEITP